MSTSANPRWPDLPFAAWRDTCDTLLLWTQIVGKVRIACTPLINHWWNSTFAVTSRGLMAAAMAHRGRTFDVVFDFAEHELRIEASDGRAEELALEPMAVADFYAAFMERLRRLDIDVQIWTMPSEIENAIPFEQDRTHTQYDKEICVAVLAGPGAGQSRVERIPHALHRQSKPGAFFLGQLRSRSNSLFRAHGATA